MAFFRPARNQTSKESVLVSDLDALESKVLSIRFQGKVYNIKPVSTGQMLRVYESFAKMDALTKKDDVTGRDQVEVLTDLFSQIIEGFGRKQVEALTQKQAGALVAVVFEALTGKAQASLERQKKSQNVESSKLKG
jgi:hypothetical protein